MFDITAFLNKGIDERPAKRWPLFGGGVFDRSQYITSSEIGYCARKNKLDKMTARNLTPGFTKTNSTEDWGFWERGHSVEAWVVENLRRGWSAADYELLYTGDDQVSFADGRQGGTPDGIALGKDDLYVLEFKSMDPRTNVSRLPKLQHVDQVIQNLDLASHLLDKSPTGGVVYYVDASNYKRRFAFPINWDPLHAKRLQRRAELIWDTAPEDLEPEGLFKDDCKYCSHTAVCSQMIRMANNGEDYHDKLKTASAALFGQRQTTP